MQQQTPLFHALVRTGLRPKPAKTPVPHPAAKRIPYKIPESLVPQLDKAGKDAAYAYFNGVTDSLERYIADAHSLNQKTAAVGALVCVSGFTALADLLVIVQHKGVAQIVPSPPTSSQLCYMVISGSADFWGARGAQAILSTVDKLRQIIPGISVSTSQASETPAQKPEGDKKTEQNNTPQKIEIVGMPQQPPIEVHIISMPARDAVVTVERDADQEIVRTIHKERDA